MKCFALERKDTKHQYKLDAIQLEKSFVKKNLRLLVDTKSIMSHPGLYQEEYCPQVEENDPSPVLNNGKASPGSRIISAGLHSIRVM